MTSNTLFLLYWCLNEERGILRSVFGRNFDVYATVQLNSVVSKILGREINYVKIGSIENWCIGSIYVF